MHPLSCNIGFRNLAGVNNQVLQRIKEFPIKVKYVVHEMSGDRQEALFGYNVFLATYMTKSALYLCATA